MGKQVDGGGCAVLFMVLVWCAWVAAIIWVVQHFLRKWW